MWEVPSDEARLIDENQFIHYASLGSIYSNLAASHEINSRPCACGGVQQGFEKYCNFGDWVWITILR